MSSLPNIRALRDEDLKLVRFLVGSALMTPLTVANSRAYRHPLTLAVWIALSSIMIRLMDWWPTTEGPGGRWGLLTPVPALASCAVPVLFFFDWFHRPVFEEALQKALTAPDMKDPLTHYTRSPASGFYILENKGKPIGFIALDAATAPLGTITGTQSKEVTSTDTALIRHFHVEDPYRVSGIQSDLLQYAVSRAFAAKSAPLRVRAMSSELDSYKVAALRATGFRPDNDGQAWKVGMFGWEQRWVEVTREEWLAKLAKGHD